MSELSLIWLSPPVSAGAGALPPERPESALPLPSGPLPDGAAAPGDAGSTPFSALLAGYLGAVQGSPPAVDPAAVDASSPESEGESQALTPGGNVLPLPGHGLPLAAAGLPDQSAPALPADTAVNDGLVEESTANPGPAPTANARNGELSDLRLPLRDGTSTRQVAPDAGQPAMSAVPARPQSAASDVLTEIALSSRPVSWRDHPAMNAASADETRPPVEWRESSRPPTVGLALDGLAVDQGTGMDTGTVDGDAPLPPLPLSPGEQLVIRQDANVVLRSELTPTAMRADTASPAGSALPTGPSASGLDGTNPLPALHVLDTEASWSHSLGDRLLTMSEQGTHTARLRLYPEYLGELDVRIQLEDGRAQVWFGASHAQAREAIEAALPKLREMFAESGLELVDAQVGQGSGGSHGQESPGDPWHRDAYRGSPAAVHGTPLAAAMNLLRTGGGDSTRRLDVFA